MTGRRRLAATVIGDGVARVWSSDPRSRVGSVVGNFTSGFYVGVRDVIFAVGGPKIAPGPIHLVIETQPPAPPDHSLVRIEPGQIRTDTCTIDLSRVVRYRPGRPSSVQLKALALSLVGLDQQYLVPVDIAHVWADVKAAVRRLDLHAARTLLEGLGTGLTPTGDDVLAGFMLFLHWTDPLSGAPTEIASNAKTTDLSRCFLTWAAVGQSIQPVHDLIDAAIGAFVGKSPDRPNQSVADEQFSQAAAVVASIGGSSGRGLLTGLRLAADAWLNGILIPKVGEKPS